MPAPDYKLYGIAPGRIVEGAKKRGAPSNEYLCNWGNQRGCLAVVRWMPKYQAWRILDIRRARNLGAYTNKRPFWRGHAQVPKNFGTADAAIMWFMHRALEQPTDI